MNVCTLVVALLFVTLPVLAEQTTGESGIDTTIMPFLKENCVRCHGPEKPKGKFTVAALDANFATGKDLLQWERVLNVLEKGEMPPEDEPQPDATKRKAVGKWIESNLRKNVAKSDPEATVATARRLTNFEYENTMRDLLGFRLKLAENLPEDPTKPYEFNNSAEFMRMGMEQMDRYLENARRAMASAIVDPKKPEIHKTEIKWKTVASDTGLASNELGVYGNRRGTPATGMGLKSWPKTGEYRIRVKAAAVLTPGITEIPLRLVMGYNLNENSSMLQYEPVGTVQLRNGADHLQVFEFRGRIENHPIQQGHVTKTGLGPPKMHLTPQNLFDDGTLNDDLNFHKARNATLPRVVIDSLEFEAPVADVWPPEHHTRILFDSPLRTTDTKAYVKEVLKRFMTRAYRRPVAADELERFEKIHATIASEFPTLEEAMRETLAMVLVSSPFLYHTATVDGVATRQYELASKLSYFLWATMPDQELFDLAAKGKLDDAKVIDQQVRRMLDDARSHDFVNNFTSQWLSIAKMKAVKINTKLFPRFLYLVPRGERAGTEEPYRPTIRDFMHDESVAFVSELIRRNASVLTIVDSDFACLNQPLAEHYGVEGVQGQELRPVALKPEHRLGGLLTQGSVLIGNGTGSAPHPIYRAVWLREAILGEDVKPPPAEVPALADSAGDAAEKAVTIKDLLRKHRKQESCNECHARLDPWGIPFEQYNAIGKYQPMVPKNGVTVRGFNATTDKDMNGYMTYLKSINTVKIEADARVPHGPEINGMEELKAYLLKSRKDDIVENVVRRLLSYGIGRKLSYRDRFAVGELVERAKKNDNKLQDIIVTICQSETFVKGH
ncbi:MAG: DUF1592 domain-containing protein [Planctomycetota bacterium]